MKERCVTAVGNAKYRADIDGLRGLAVSLVAIYHYFPNICHGGFIGVDIFFVISGYLITAIILDEQNSGNFGFVAFYRRRVRRIFPALLVLLMSSLLLGWFVLLAEDYKQLGKHVAAAALFVPNFVLWSETGYFDLAADSKLMLHLWSLGIEEQFYFFWPALLWMSTRYSVRPMMLVFVIGGLSFTFSAATTFHDELAASYSPLTRLWELLVGAAMACHQGSTPSNERKNHQPDARSWLGISLMLVGAAILTKDDYFPGWWALVPTIGAAMTISSGPRAWVNHAVLSNRLLVWIGLISFPLYLWHWPVLSVMRILEDRPPGIAARLVSLVASLALAWLTYRYVEKPMRHGRLLEVKSLVLLVLVMLVGGAGLGVFLSDGMASRDSIQALQTARDELAWPVNFIRRDACLNRHGTHHYYCAMEGQGPATVALIGDSHANHFYPGFAVEYAKNGETLIHLGDPGCPPILGVTSRHPKAGEQCGQNSGDVLRAVANDQGIHTVILAANWHLYMLGTRYRDKSTTASPWILGANSKPSPTTNIEVFEKQFRETIRMLKLADKRIMIIKQVPELDCMRAMRIGKNPFAVSSALNGCHGNARDIREYLAEYEKHFDHMLAEFDGLTTIDPAPFFCDANHCRSMNLAGLLYRDDLHLSVAGSKAFARNVFER